MCVPETFSQREPNRGNFLMKQTTATKWENVLHARFGGCRSELLLNEGGRKHMIILCGTAQFWVRKWNHNDYLVISKSHQGCKIFSNNSLFYFLSWRVKCQIASEFTSPFLSENNWQKTGSLKSLTGLFCLLINLASLRCLSALSLCLSEATAVC